MSLARSTFPTGLLPSVIAKISQHARAYLCHLPFLQFFSMHTSDKINTLQGSESQLHVDCMIEKGSKHATNKLLDKHTLPYIMPAC